MRCSVSSPIYLILRLMMNRRHLHFFNDCIEEIVRGIADSCHVSGLECAGSFARKRKSKKFTMYTVDWHYRHRSRSQWSSKTIIYSDNGAQADFQAHEAVNCFALLSFPPKTCHGSCGTLLNVCHFFLDLKCGIGMEYTTIVLWFFE